jgi:hypothetical protein
MILALIAPVLLEIGTFLLLSVELISGYRKLSIEIRENPHQNLIKNGILYTFQICEISEFQL